MVAVSIGIIAKRRNSVQRKKLGVGHQDAPNPEHSAIICELCLEKFRAETACQKWKKKIQKSLFSEQKQKSELRCPGFLSVKRTPGFAVFGFLFDVFVILRLPSILKSKIRI